MKLRNKMVMSCFLFFILPFMIVGFFVVQQYRQSALDKAIEQSENTIERIKNRTSEVLNVSIGLSNRMTIDNDLKKIANAHYLNTIDVVDAYRDYDKFKVYLDFNPEVSKINLYVDNPTLLNNWEFYPLNAETKSAFWYESALKNAGLIGWYYYPTDSRHNANMLSLVRSIYFPETRTFGMLTIDVNTGYLNSILRQEDSEIVLADENGVIVSSNRPSMVGKKLDDTHFGYGMSRQEAGTREMVIEGRKSQVRIDRLSPEKSYNSLMIVTVSAIDEMVREANRISTVGLEIIGIAGILALLLIYFICTVMTNRLLKFSKQISKVSMGNFNTELTVDGNDEIGQISRQFNQMVGNVKELMEEVSRSHQETSELERKQSEIKLKMLASQINPHFLYNALESIRMKAHLRGEKEISQTVKTLGKLMRKNLELKGQPISLKEEIDIVRCYLEIQKFRHDERLDYKLDIAPEAENVSILPLLIQPIVENSVIHGLEKNVEGGKVTVTARLSQGGLRVTVEDDGIGISRPKLNAVQQSLKEQDADRIGLHNVQQRLLLTYGELSGLRIESEKQTGTKITFWIPVEE
ncbi:sensor histidine kinase [Cohnella faecalis]